MLPFRTSIVPLLLNLVIAASPVYPEAAFKENPTTPFMSAWPGCASKVAVNGAVCPRNAAFDQAVDELRTQVADAACVAHNANATARTNALGLNVLLKRNAATRSIHKAEHTNPELLILFIVSSGLETAPGPKFGRVR